MSDDVDWGLLAKYFFGECSEEEEAKVRAWMEEDPKREVLLEELRQVRRLTRSPSSPESWDTRALWKPGGGATLSEVLNVVATAFGMEYERHRKRITFTSGETPRSC